MSNDGGVHDLVISGGIVVSATGEAALDVAIDGEQITGLYPPGTAGEAGARSTHGAASSSPAASTRTCTTR